MDTLQFSFRNNDNRKNGRRFVSTRTASTTARTKGHSLLALRSKCFQPHQQRNVKTQHQEDWFATWEKLSGLLRLFKVDLDQKSPGICTRVASLTNGRSGISDKPANNRDWAQRTAPPCATVPTGNVSGDGTQSWSRSQDLAQ